MVAVKDLDEPAQHRDEEGLREQEEEAHHERARRVLLDLILDHIVVLAE